MKNLMTFLLELLGMCPLKWNPHRERFEICYVRYIYSTVLAIILTVIDPISFIFLLDSSSVFADASIQMYACLIDYATSFFALLTIHIAQTHSPKKLVNLCNEWRRFFLAIDSDRQRQALQTFATKRAILSMVLAGGGVFAHIYCINFLVEGPTMPLTFLGSCIACLPTIMVTLFLVIYNSTMYLALETFQQICRRLRALMLVLDGQQEQEKRLRMSEYRKLKLFCDISEQIDALAISHKDIFDFLTRFNDHYSVSMLVFVLNVFCSVLNQTFFFYMNLAGAVRQDTGAGAVFGQFVGGDVFYAFMVTVQIFFVVEATTAVIEIARSVGLQLHQVVSRSFDERLEQSIETFSIQLLMQDMNIQVCGLFNLDHDLIFSIIGAVSTYLIILIQFDLMRY